MLYTINGKTYNIHTFAGTGHMMTGPVQIKYLSGNTGINESKKKRDFVPLSN
jgi:hypothetical protein